MARIFSKRDTELRKQPKANPARSVERGQRSQRPLAMVRTQVEIRRETPEEALRLTEDIQAMRLAGALIGSIDALNIMDTLTQGERDTAEELRRNLCSSLRNWQRYAEAKLRKKYLV